jgi:RecA-family ATPase
MNAITNLHGHEVNERSLTAFPVTNSRSADLAQKMCHVDKIEPNLRGNYLVKGWFDRGSASVVFGESNVGKTFFALDLAMHVAAGRDWHGCKTSATSRGNHADAVYYVASEGGSGINNRITAMRHENGNLVRSANLILLPVSLDLCGQNDGAELARTINEKTGGAVLIVIDTLARAMGSGDENTTKDMGAFIQNVDLLRERTGAHVMIIHHSGKDKSKGARGSSSLRAAVDTEIELVRYGSTVMAETQKQRDMSCGKVFAYSLKSVFLGLDEDGDKVFSAVVQLAEPFKKKLKLNASDNAALQALEDVLADHGELKDVDGLPSDRKCVQIAKWRDLCKEKSIAKGSLENTARQAFGRALKSLQSKNIVAVLKDYAFKSEEG